MDEFLRNALLGGVGAALAAGPLGAVMAWRRMAWFGDTLAHAALLGVALGLLWELERYVAVTLVCLLLAALLTLLQRRRRLSADVLLGILSHAALAVGLILLARMESPQANLMGWLFGDILSIADGELAWIWGGSLCSLLLLLWIWRPLLALTVDEELARVEGVPTAAVRFVAVLLVALTVAAAMKVTGVLLISALLVIPAAAARPFARTPEAMALLAALFGAAAVAGGLAASLRWDAPAGPAIVAAATLLFALSQLKRSG